MAQVLSNQWIMKRRPHWERLAQLLAQADSGGLAQLSREELRETALLYRQVASDLSTLRSDTTAAAYARHVNQLLARAHHIIYSGRKTSFLAVFRFLRDDYPAIFQRQLGYVAAATGLFVAGGLLGVVLSLARPTFMHQFVPLRLWASIERHEMWTHSIVSVGPQMTSAIMTNNLTVSFAAFAGGMVFGLLTVWSMFNNGLMMGVLGVACAQHGMAVDLWSFCAPHGSLEIPAIVIAGGAGLRLAQGILFPGLYKWKDSIALAGKESTQLVVGMIPLLIVAGSIEGFFSPSGAPIPLKFLVGAALFLALLLWLFRPSAARGAGG